MVHSDTIFNLVQFSPSVLSDSLCPQTTCQASLSITNSRNLLKLMSIESVIPANHLILGRTLLLPPSIFPSIRVLSKESVLAKILEFQFQHQSFLNEHSGLISFRMDWLDLLDVQGTLKSLLQHHSSKASVLRVQLSHPYTTTGETIALFVSKLMDLCQQSCLSWSQLFFQGASVF